MRGGMTDAKKEKRAGTAQRSADTDDGSHPAL